MMNGKCECSMSISMLGDGCRYCQPQEYIDRLHESIEEDMAEVEELAALKQELQELREQKPWTYCRTKDGLPDWSEDCFGDKDTVLDGCDDLERYGAIPLYAATMPAREGWKLVPSIPTDEMVMAAIDAQDNYPSNSWGKARDLPYEKVYEAMLEAAPKL